MSHVKIGDVKKLISKTEKISNIDQKNYHKRFYISKNSTGPVVEITVTRSSGPFSSPENLKVVYSFEEIFITSSKFEIEAIIQLIKTKETELKDKIIEKKELEFLKLINE